MFESAEVINIEFSSLLTMRVAPFPAIARIPLIKPSILGSLPRFATARMAESNSDQPNGASATSVAPPLASYTPRYIDVSIGGDYLTYHILNSDFIHQIGINLADPIFRGRYHGKSRHPDDLKAVVGRAVEVGCTKLIVTGSSFKSSRDALKLAKQFRQFSLPTTPGLSLEP